MQPGVLEEKHDLVHLRKNSQPKITICAFPTERNMQRQNNRRKQF